MRRITHFAMNLHDEFIQNLRSNDNHFGYINFQTDELNENCQCTQSQLAAITLRI